MDNDRVRLEIFGQVYHLRGDDPDVDAQEVVDYVQTQISELEDAHQGLPQHKMVVLAVLHMAKDSVMARQRLRILEDTIVDRTSRIVSKIDATMDCDD